jgi:hypothetical protein
MKNKVIILLALPTLFLWQGCTKDFAEINTNNNVPTSVTPDLLLSGIIRNMMNHQVNEAWGIGNLVVQYNAKIQFVNEDRYLWNEQNSVWNTVYGNFRNLQNILTQVGTSNDDAYYGVALVLKSWMFSTVTNAYGDVPYAEAGLAKLEGNYQPRYDKQEDIYTSILADLKKANDVLSKSKNTVSGDILFGGGTQANLKWRKLSNSLRLRLLMRMSKKKNVNAEMQEIVGNPALYPVFTSNSDNAELRFLPAPPNQWPLYGARVGSFDEVRISKTLTTRLTALKDPRLQIFGRPTQKSVAAGTPVIEGIPNGLSDVDALAFNGGPQGVSRVGFTFACLVCTDPGQAPPDPSAPRSIIMNYSELQFILAEAREKGMISVGNAEEFYNNGIKSNFDYWKNLVPVQYGYDLNPPADYFTQGGVAYTGTTEEKLKKIYLQRWIAMYFNGLESWFEWRRTGSPEIIPGPANLNNDKVPVRYIYPLSEQSLNGKNRQEAVARQGNTDDLNTRMWLLQ